METSVIIILSSAWIVSGPTVMISISSNFLVSKPFKLTGVTLMSKIADSDSTSNHLGIGYEFSKSSSTMHMIETPEQVSATGLRPKEY